METSQKQMILRGTDEFLKRLEYLMVVQAVVVLSEALNTTHHAERVNYAKLVVNFPSEYAQKASTMVAGGVNITSTTSSDGQDCSATDAAFLSQIATYWNNLAGVEQGS